MATPLGSEIQVGLGYETADQIPTAAVTKFFRVKGVSGIHAKRSSEFSENLDPSGQRLRSFQMPAAISRKYDFQPKVDDLSYLLSLHCGYHGTITDLTGAYSWAIRPLEQGDSAPSYLSSFCTEIDPNDDAPIFVMGERFVDLDVNIAANKIVNCSLSSIGCRDTYYNEPAMTGGAGSAYVGHVTVYGHPSATHAAKVLKFKCTTPGALDGTAKIKMTSDATAYGATEYAVTAGTPMRFYLADGSEVGISRSEAVWVVFEAGDPLVADDAWEVAVARTAQTASYSTQNELTAADVDVSIGGSIVPMSSCSIKISAPKKPYYAVGSKYASTIQKNGVWTATFSFDRDANDRNNLLRLIRATNVAVYVDMYGDLIGATAFRQQWKINATNCLVTDVSRDVSSPNALPEKVVIEAYRSGSTAIVDHTVVCTKATLTS